MNRPEKLLIVFRDLLVSGRSPLSRLAASLDSILLDPCLPEHARWLDSCSTVMQVEQTLLSYHQSARDQQPWFHWREADRPRGHSVQHANESFAEINTKRLKTSKYI